MGNTRKRSQSAIPSSSAWEHLVAGRGALADRHTETNEDRLTHENSPIAHLLTLLWHEDPSIRRAAALALPGGDRHKAYVPSYGHFAGAFLRGLTNRAEVAPESAAARFAVVVAALRALLDQNAFDIHAMNNMHYSFLSSALYLAMLCTCRDAIEAARRIRASAAHSELCRLLRLLYNLSRRGLMRKLNSHDVEALAQTAGRAVAALPPDQIPEFWHSLTHHSLPRRLAVAPVLPHLSDSRAVPYLLDALPGQPPRLAQPMIGCLARIGDQRALPALNRIAEDGDRLLRNHAQAAITAIERANAGTPARTLLRPANVPAENLLRPALPIANDPPNELLRIHSLSG